MKLSAIANSVFNAGERLDRHSSALIAKPTMLVGMGEVFENDVRLSAEERREYLDDHIGNYFNDAADGFGAAAGGLIALPVTLVQLTYRYGLKGIAKTIKLASKPFLPRNA